MNKKLFIPFILIPLLMPLNKIAPKTNNKSQAGNQLELVQAPYLTTLSLGDDLYLDGLIVKDNDNVIPINDLSFSGHDLQNLGEQTITITYEAKYSSFDIYVTNDYVYNYLPPTGGLFISEFMYLSDEEIAIELFNNTNAVVELHNYEILLKNDTNEIALTLEAQTINAKEAFIITNIDTQSLPNYYKNFSFNEVKEVILEKDHNVVDQLINENEDINNFAVRRHYKVFGPSEVFITKEWIRTDDTFDNLGYHTVLESIVSVKEQARAYARYVLFGAGMFAAGRTHEAFEALKYEYNLMNEVAKDYFNKNVNEEVEGYNESGRYVGMKFREAHSRIALLASTTGNTSFLPQKSKTLFEIDAKTLILLGFVFILLAGGFIIIKYKKTPKQQ